VNLTLLHAVSRAFPKKFTSIKMQQGNQTIYVSWLGDIYYGNPLL
jgi:hypothetical protein